MDDKGNLTQGKTYDHNRHLPKGTRRAGIRTNRKQYDDNKVEKGEVFWSQTEPFEMVLGDEKVPHGLWKAIEHMHKGEKARVMVKPAYGYGYPQTARTVKFPDGWTDDDKKRQLKMRRTFFDVKLHSWVIRHDLLSDGSLIKTISERGVGYDRPSNYDEIKMTLKVH